MLMICAGNIMDSVSWLVVGYILASLIKHFYYRPSYL